jgi:4a-hydroxytetrahydrobiopterin dehydratase
MSHLSERSCKVVSDNEGLGENDINHYSAQLHRDWRTEEGVLRRELGFRDMDEAHSFAGDIKELAEKQGHFPDMRLSYGTLEVILETSEVDGHHENDFIMASKIDRLEKRFQSNV